MGLLLQRLWSINCLIFTEVTLRNLVLWVFLPDLFIVSIAVAWTRYLPVEMTESYAALKDIQQGVYSTCSWSSMSYLRPSFSYLAHILVTEFSDNFVIHLEEVVCLNPHTASIGAHIVHPVRLYGHAILTAAG